MLKQYENRISGDSPFKPEFEGYINSHPGRGSLRVQVSAANRSFPVKNVFVEVAVTVQDRIETILPVALEPLGGSEEA